MRSSSTRLKIIPVNRTNCGLFITTNMDAGFLMSSVDTLLPYLVPVTLLMLSVSLWGYYINSTRDVQSNLPLPPGTVGWPFVGETFHMIFKGFDFYRERRQKYGHVYKTHVLGKPTIRIWGTENIRKVLKNEETLVTMQWPTSVNELMGRGGLITSTRRLHSTRRAAIMKAFSASAINGYSAGMETVIQKYIADWCQRGQVMAVKESKRLAFEATARMLLGCEFSQEQMNTMMSCMTVMVDNFFTLAIDLPGFGFHKAMKARRTLLKTLDEIISQRHAEGSNTTDAISILREQVEDGSLSMDELKDTIIEMLFSAFHGMSSLCCSTFTELARNPEVANKVAQELDQANLLQGGNLSMDQVSKLSYLQQVCKELLRFAPPYGGGFRQVLKTFELEGYQIPKGWTVLYSIRDQHEVEENFTNARTFNPERWDLNKPNDAYIPFGGNGIRSCIGEKYMMMFVQLFVCQTVRGCQWELVDPATRFSYFPVQTPTNGLPLNFTDNYRKVSA